MVDANLTRESCRSRRRGRTFFSALSVSGCLLWASATVRAEESFVLEGHEGGVRVLAFGTDGKQLFSGGFDGSVRFWNVLEERSAHVVMPGGEIRGLAVSPDGSCVAAATQKGMVRVWLTKYGSERKTVQAAPGTIPAVVGVGFQSDGQAVAVGLADGMVKVIDLRTGKATRTLSDPGRLNLSSFALRPDGDVPVVGTPAQKVLVLDVQTGAAVETYDVPEDYPSRLACSREGGRVAAAAGITVRVFRPGLPPLVLAGHSGQVEALGFSRDGTRLATCSRDQTVRVWDTDKGETLARLHVSTGLPLSVAISPDGERVAAGETTGRIYVWTLKAADGGGK